MLPIYLRHHVVHDTFIPWNVCLQAWNQSSILVSRESRRPTVNCETSGAVYLQHKDSSVDVTQDGRH